MKEIINISQATDQQELIVLENEYKVANTLNYHIFEVKDILESFTSSFFKLGYHLFELKNNWSESLTKSDFYKYCEENFNLKSTSIKNFIKVYESFKDKDNPGEIDKRFEGFSFSALVELIPVADDKEFAKNCKKLSSREIRSVVRVKDVYDTKDMFLQRLFNLVKNIFEKNGLSCEFEEMSDNKVYFNLLISKEKDLDARCWIQLELLDYEDCAYYFDLDETIIGLRSYYNYKIPALYKDFSISNLEESINEISMDCLKALNDISDDEDCDDEDCDDEESETVEEPICASGAAHELGLKESEIIDYLEDFENITERYTHISSISQLGIHIWKFNYCEGIYLIEIINKETGKIEDSTFRFVNEELYEIHSWKLKELML